MRYSLLLLVFLYGLVPPNPTYGVSSLPYDLFVKEHAAYNKETNEAGNAIMKTDGNHADYVRFVALFVHMMVVISIV